MNRTGSRPLSRRAFVAAAGVGAGCLAGCLNRSEEPEGDSEDEPEPIELVDHPGDEPIEPPEEYRCPVCNMLPADWDNSNAQLVHEGEGATFFDSAGCLFNYYVDPAKEGGPDAEISAVWTTGHESLDLIDATEASFVLEHDQERIDAPMDSPVPFADRDDAVAYVEEYDDLTEDDIVGLKDADSEAASIY
ncbi:nitrous oxide reductase accessory protein NosL [Halostagnicola kamekurae]|uniref:NosL protein n=1 Tax=Halostagnicola kamekurae TaxID=619731 RepID=A0A1I6SJH6_9EURY|nr:nitrous oxide reductase accessory protein NosL [Halostagnicola kamekurae]SFS77000.1 NosL protein [Halostagnicola kamekurae]